VRFVIFTHSLLSDWNHGNAHFLRGVCTELKSRGHELQVYEPEDGWSLQNLLRDAGPAAIEGFRYKYPDLESTFYDEKTLDISATLAGADVVLVHEWNGSDLIRKVGQHRAKHDFKLLFHDTHHRSLTDRAAIAEYELEHYDCVLAYGNVIRDVYLQSGWINRAVTWHEAADTRVFKPLQADKCGDLVWIGNWGDNERAAELREYLIRPVKELGLRATVYGVRYPADVLDELSDAGIEYKGWLPNYCVPEVFARHRLTVHVPRRPYVEALPGIPTIRLFEALACAIPLISAPWRDEEQLFRPGTDFVFAQSGQAMREQMQRLLTDPEAAHRQASNGLTTVRERHTCAHRVDELMEVING